MINNDWKVEIRYNEVADGVRVGVTVRSDNEVEAINSINRIYRTIRKNKRMTFTKFETGEWH